MKSTLVLTAAAFLLAACKPAPVPLDDVRLVRTMTVGESPTTASNTYAGEVRARYESALAFRVGGKITVRAVNAGDTVRAGQVLARLDPTDLNLGDAAASAQVAAAQAQFNVAKTDLERVRGLHAKKYSSQGELDRFTTQFEAAQAQLQAAQAQRNQVANQARYSTLTADSDGVVLAVLAEAGQVVAAGQPVVQVAKAGAIEIATALPEDRINSARVGMPVRVSLWAGDGASYAATVREIASTADPLTRTYALRVAVTNPPAAMRLRMTAAVTVPHEGIPDLVHVPASAMVTQQGKAGVWVVQPKLDTVSFRPIEFGGVERNEVLVRAGLKTGEVIATAGASYLREGQKVRLMQPAPVTAKPAAPAAAAP
jgi:RND family efflux transporter MFP subunit